MAIADEVVAIEAAEAGAAVVRSHYGSPLTRVDKGAGDFATTADIEAERAITDLLRRARPDDVVLGEETGRTGVDGNGRMWLIDGRPLYTGRGGLVVAADNQTHANLATLISGQRAGA